MKGEFTFRRGVAKTIVFPLITDGGDDYYSGSLTSVSVTAYKYGQSNTPSAQTITSTPTELGSTGLWYITLTSTETDIGSTNRFLIVKINATEIKEQSVILSSAVEMNRLVLEHDIGSEPTVDIKGADGSFVAGDGVKITGGSASDNGSTGGNAIECLGGAGATAGTNGEGGAGIELRGGAGKGVAPGGVGLEVIGGSGDGNAIFLETTGTGSGIKMETYYGIDINSDDDCVRLIPTNAGNGNGITINTTNTAGGEGVSILTSGAGIEIDAGTLGISIDSAGNQGILVVGGAGHAAVEFRGRSSSTVSDSGHGLLITGGTSSGTGANGSGIVVVGGNGGSTNPPGDGINVTGGESDDSFTNAGHGIISSAGAAVLAGGAGIKAVATGDGIDLDADNLSQISTISTLETKIDTVDTVVDGIATDLSTIEGKIDTVDTVVDGIASDIAVVDGNVDTIVAKLPAGTISDLTLSATVDGVTIQTIFEYMMAMFNGRYLIDTPSAGDITYYKRDNVTPITEINRTTAGRSRIS